MDKCENCESKEAEFYPKADVDLCEKCAVDLGYASRADREET